MGRREFISAGAALASGLQVILSRRVNLKTAKALGLTVPDKLLAIADEVIE